MEAVHDSSVWSHRKTWSRPAASGVHDELGRSPPGAERAVRLLEGGHTRHISGDRQDFPALLLG